MEIKIKAFENLDNNELYDILKIRNEVFILEQKCLYLDIDDKDKKAYHLYIKENDNITAYLRIVQRNVSYSEVSIGRVIVKPEHRGRGLGKIALKRAIEFIENDLCESEIRISAQAHLTELYKNVGFRVVSGIYLEDDIPHLEMFYNNKK